jgi:deoxyribose-phosphate aldolase
VAETVQVLRDGATEIDMVMNLPVSLTKIMPMEEDNAEVVKAASDFGRTVKVIIETGNLSDEQKTYRSNLGGCGHADM